MRARSLAPLVWLGLAWWSCGCPAPAKVLVKDESGQEREVTPAEAARITWQAAKSAREAGRSQEAREKLLALLEKFPDSEWHDDALEALGTICVQQERHDEAAGYFRRLVAEHPQSPHYLRGVVQLGLALARAGKMAEAVPTLQSVFGRLSDDAQRAEVAGLLAENFWKGGEGVEALRWFSLLYRLTRVPGAREVIEEQVLELIDGLDFTGVRRAFEMLRQMGKDFPADLVALKLAKVLFHILDFGRAREQLESFLAEYPGHPRTAEAATLLKLIEERGKVNPLAVGVLLPLSGEFRQYGQNVLEGIQLGAGVFENEKDPNAPVLIVRDTAGDPQKAVEQLEDLVFNEHVVAVIGPLVAKETYAAAMKAEELEVPLVTLSIRQDVTKLGKWVFRNFLTVAAQAETLVAYAMDKLGARRFALLYPNDWYGVEFANALWDEIERRHGEVRGAESYEPDQKNFAPQVKKLVGRFHLEARWDFITERNRIRKEAKTSLERQRAMDKLVKSLPPVVDFDVLFLPDYAEKVVLVAPALAVEDIILHTESQWQIERLKKSLNREKLDMIYLMGGNGWNDPRLVEWAERYVQGAIFCDGFFADSARPATRAFVESFRAAFKRVPSMMEAHGFDTARLLRQLLKERRPADRQQMARALYELKDFEGATGRTSFNSEGEAVKELFLLTVEKDVIKEIDTSSANAGKS